MTVALLYDSIALNHHTGSHPENARRLQAVTDRLKSEGLWDALSPTDRRRTADSGNAPNGGLAESGE